MQPFSYILYDSTASENCVVVPALILTYYTTQLLVYTLIAEKALMPASSHPSFGEFRGKVGGLSQRLQSKFGLTSKLTKSCRNFIEKGMLLAFPESKRPMQIDKQTFPKRVHTAGVTKMEEENPLLGWSRAIKIESVRASSLCLVDRISNLQNPYGVGLGQRFELGQARERERQGAQRQGSG